MLLVLILSIVSSKSVFQALINQYVGVKFACAVLPSVAIPMFTIRCLQAESEHRLAKDC